MGEDMSRLQITRLLSHLTLLLSSGILLYFLLVYVQFVITETYRHGWWLIGFGTGAGFIYGLSGIFQVLTGDPVFSLFREGASLFFILFLALGIRAVSLLGDTVDGEQASPTVFLDYFIVGFFVVAWWLPFLAGTRTYTLWIEAIGWVGALLLALVYGIRAVYRFEGTSLSAVVRQLLPAVFCFGAIVLVELVTLTVGPYQELLDAVWIVGIVLVGAFLFSTAVSIKQQETEIYRMH